MFGQKQGYKQYKERETDRKIHQTKVGKLEVEQTEDKTIDRTVGKLNTLLKSL